MTRICLWLVKIYRQAISPFLRPSCRYLPTCSEYAEHALKAHGWATGGKKTFARLLRCQPFGGSGYDPL